MFMIITSFADIYPEKQYRKSDPGPLFMQKIRNFNIGNPPNYYNRYSIIVQSIFTTRLFILLTRKKKEVKCDINKN